MLKENQVFPEDSPDLYNKNTVKEDKPIFSKHMPLNEIPNYLISLKEKFVEENPIDPYKIFLEEFDYYSKNEFRESINEFKDKIKQKISNDDLKKLSLRGLKICDVDMPILNYFAYHKEIEIMKFLFETFENQSLEIFPDFRDKDVLEIALELKNITMINLIINETTKNPPSYKSWKNLSKNIILSLLKFKINNLGSFIDSRSFAIKTNGSLNYSAYFPGFKSFVCDKLPLSEKSIRDFLIKSHKRDDSQNEYLIELRFLDIKDFVLDGEYCLKEINDFYSGENEIYASRVVNALASKHWLAYGIVGYLVKFIFVAFELFYFYSLTDYIPSFPTEKYPTVTADSTILILIVFGIIILLEFIPEFEEVRKKSLKIYLSSEEKLFDFFAIIFFIIMFVYYSMQYHYAVNNEQLTENFLESKLILQGLFYMIVGWRICWMSQILPNFGFYLRMITYTIQYILLFFILFALIIVIICWTLAGAIGDLDKTTDFNWSIGNFLKVYKAAFGDTQDFFQIFEPGTPRYNFIYFLYFVVSIILQVILLNIVITLLAEGYGNLRIHAENLKLKANINSLMGAKGKNKLLLVENKVHYKWYESVLYYIKFSIYNYLLRKTITRENFKGNFFVFSCIADVDRVLADQTKNYYYNGGKTINSLEDFIEHN